jgi:hypothetical protein
MTIIIDGTGTISGVSATGLTTAQTVGYAQLPTGSVLQVVYAQTTTRTTGNSTSYVDISGLTASITPKFSTSKILAIINISMGTANGVDGGESPCSVNLVRASTQVYAITRMSDLRASVYAGESNLYFGGGFTYLDSPATTSSTTYKCQVKQNGSFNRSYDVSSGSSPSSITLLEIAG